MAIKGCYHFYMNKRHQKTLDTIFAQPISGNIKWRDVENLLKNVGATLQERAGSRVAISLNNQIAVFHRPHPSPNMDKGAVKDVRRFLENAGVRP